MEEEEEKNKEHLNSCCEELLDKWFTHVRLSNRNLVPHDTAAIFPLHCYHVPTSIQDYN